ncbi:MAG: hypothetical protein COW65_00535 [Cytophagales bacterium CG18_big_fil_WC_8_21_14_2_50_42_9]|nr:MAG: hypothetical protein COW65_00535 [Cytophagales bacterium CG18_big_fil_WC_8_21_14_2_50_42_9]
MPIENNLLDFTFQCFFQGVLITQLLNVVINLYNNSQRKEYFFYIAYLLAAILYFLYKTIMLYKMGWEYGAYPFPHNGLNYILANIIHLAYLKFAQAFINTKENYPSIHRLAQHTQQFILIFIFFNVVSLVFYQILLPVFVQYAFSGLLSIVSSILIGQMFCKRNRLVNYIVWGGTAYLVGALLSLLAAALRVHRVLPNFKYSLIITQAGVLIEVLCFTAGLAYKTLLAEQDRMAGQQKLLRQMQENEKLREHLGQIKAKVTRELQDEMGATLTGISVYSDIGLKYSEQQNSQGVTSILEQIGETARQMVNEVQDIIWMIHSQNPKSAIMWQKAYQYATDAVLGKNIELHFYISKEVEKLSLDLQLRKNVYLLIKECIDNSIKHARCKNNWVTFRLNQQKLILNIRDDGKGFVPDEVGAGNGLFKLKKWVRNCGGEIDIRSDGAGTAFHFECEVEKELPLNYY